MSAPRFLCDEMLGRLARYLRAAGYDTSLAEPGEADAALLRRARAERRRFLTRDARIAEHRDAADTAFVLPAADLAAMASLLRSAEGVDWLHRPFTRCLVDNAELVPAPANAATPPDVRASDASVCPTCGRVYWAGSHHRRMLARLRAWSA